MSARGWAVAGIASGLVVGVAADRDVRRRMTEQARSVQTTVTGRATEVRDRVAETAGGVRDRNAERWSTALLEAAEARDDALDPLDDEDDARS